MSGYFTSQSIFFLSLDSLFVKKEHTQQKKSPFDKKKSCKNLPNTGNSSEGTQKQVARFKFSEQAVEWWDHLPVFLPIRPIHQNFQCLINDNVRSCTTIFFSRFQLLTVEAASSRREGSTWHHLPPPTHRCPPSFPGSRPA